MAVTDGTPVGALFSNQIPEAHRWPYVDIHPALDRIPEIKVNVDELLRRRDRLIDKLIAGVRDWDDYLSTAGEVRGLNAGITTPYRPRSSTS